MKKYRVREGSLADYGRIFLTSAVLTFVLMAVVHFSYGM